MTIIYPHYNIYFSDLPLCTKWADLILHEFNVANDECSYSFTLKEIHYAETRLLFLGFLSSVKFDSTKHKYLTIRKVQFPRKFALRQRLRVTSQIFSYISSFLLLSSFLLNCIFANSFLLSKIIDFEVTCITLTFELKYIIVS